jgi:hypothetical protein
MTKIYHRGEAGEDRQDALPARDRYDGADQLRGDHRAELVTERHQSNWRRAGGLRIRGRGPLIDGRARPHHSHRERRNRQPKWHQ